ncbi:MAG TPA: dephospho-CoA kinase [Spirochaetota bacterium]|nr:dephospho-CoA kinase [Spirochaetota bacterium]HNT09743.1 dephospho-CoA kinase [Spirochaetota bacterium]
MNIGVTGIFASGKGTVCEMFRALGARVIDTDILAREVVAPGTEGLNRLVAAFGTDILTPSGELDRRGLALRVFPDPAHVQQVNAIVHPLVLARMLEIVGEAPDSIYMINTPLLYESGFDRYMHKNIVVTADTEQAISRGMRRDHLTAEEIESRLKHQIPLTQKMHRADYVIDNSSSLENTRRQVIEIWNSLTEKPRGE